MKQEIGNSPVYPNLKARIAAKGIRQNRLCQSLGVDPTTFNKIVQGVREPSPELRLSISLLLEADAAWLFDKSASAA